MENAFTQRKDTENMGGMYIKMLNYNIDSVKSAEKLIRLCEKYHDDMDIDIMHGRTVVDGCSLLGVTSLIGHFVTVKPNGKDENAVQRFSKELERLKC